MIVARIILWLSTGILLYGYVIYPLLVMAIARTRRRQLQTDEGFQPSVSIILAAYNEERAIEACLEGLRTLAYPGNWEILIGSDGSSDRTAEILTAAERTMPRLRAFNFEARRGKIPVINDLVHRATGEILLLTDADVALDRALIARHVRHYSNPEIGGVAGSLDLIDDQQQHAARTESDYMRWEERLREAEAAIKSTIGIFGGNYSIRRNLWKEIPDGPLCDEMYAGLNVMAAKHRMVFDREAVAREPLHRNVREEYSRKARFAARGMHTIMAFRHFWQRSLFYASMVVTHKMLRWMTPFVLLIFIIAFLADALIRHNALELTLVTIAAVSILLASIEPIRSRLKLLASLWWFLVMNLAFAVGIIRFIFGTERKFWIPASRSLSATTHHVEQADITQYQ